MRASDPDNSRDQDLEAAARRLAGGVEQARALARQFHAFKDNYEDMNFTPPYLSTITASTLIVHGDRDPYFPVSIPVEEYEAIPDSYLWIIPNAGHSPPFESESERAMFTQIVLDFLAGKWQ